MKKYLTLTMLYEGGRNFAGALTIAYMLSCGLSVSDVAQLKMIQMITVVLLELPTGMIADYYGRRFSILISAVFGAVAFCIYSSSKTFLGFAFAEFLLGFSLSCWSGAYEAFAIDQQNLNAGKEKMSKFFFYSSSLSSAAVMICGYLGATLSVNNQILAFILCAATLSFLSVFIFTKFTRDFGTATSIRKSIMENFQAARLDSGLMLPIIGIICINLVIIPTIYYWQPLFQNSSGISTEIGETIGLGSIFVLIQLVIWISGNILARTTKYLDTTSFKVLSMAILGFTVTQFLIGTLSGYRAILFSFLLSEVFYMVWVNAHKIQINLKINSESRASTMSVISLFGKAGSFISLLLISVSYKKQTQDLSFMDVQKMYVAASFFVVFFMVWFAYVSFKNKVSVKR